MAKPPAVPVDLEQLNDSELVLLAKWNGLPASRGMPREMLIESLETFHPADVVVPLDDIRELMSKWLKIHWAQIRMQIKKKVCPECFKCRDIQVLSCYSKIESHIKPGPSYQKKARAK
jgi:hypothetical protein